MDKMANNINRMAPPVPDSQDNLASRMASLIWPVAQSHGGEPVLATLASSNARSSLLYSSLHWARAKLRRPGVAAALIAVRSLIRDHAAASLVRYG